MMPLVDEMKATFTKGSRKRNVSIISPIVFKFATNKTYRVQPPKIYQKDIDLSV